MEAHNALELRAGTFFLAANLFDRYSFHLKSYHDQVIPAYHYQLVGCTALFVAAKYLDQRNKVPTVAELERLCNSCYEKDLFKKMEWELLSALGWQVGHPDVHAFIQLTTNGQSSELELLSTYIAEVATLGRLFACTKPSELARTALTLARVILTRCTLELGDEDKPFNPQLYLALWRCLSLSPKVLNSKYISSRQHVLKHNEWIMQSYLHPPFFLPCVPNDFACRTMIRYPKNGP